MAASLVLPDLIPLEVKLLNVCYALLVPNLPVDPYLPVCPNSVQKINSPFKNQQLIRNLLVAFHVQKEQFQKEEEALAVIKRIIIID